MGGEKNSKKRQLGRIFAYLCFFSFAILVSGSVFAHDFERIPGEAVASPNSATGTSHEAVASANSTTQIGISNTKDDGENIPQFSPIQPENSPEQKTQESEQEAFLRKLKNELNISKSEYSQITRNIKETKNRIQNLRTDMSELQNQMFYFDDQISKISEKLFSVLRQLVKAENEMKILYEEIEIKKVALEYQKTLLRDYIRELYICGDTYLDVNALGEIDAFKILLADGNTGDILKEIKYLGILEETGSRIVERLDELVDELAVAGNKIDEKRVLFLGLEEELRIQKENLEMQKASKESLLIISKSQDEIFRALLQQSMEEQERSLAEVQAFQDTIAFIEEKIVEDGDSFDVSKYKNLVGEKFMSIYDFHSGVSVNTGFVWPIMPDRGISAHFHDPSYYGFFGVQHRAVDVRASQGTPVFAVADGIVYKAADNGLGYSYITLAHHNNLMTVYGHISNILVEEGQVVPQGAIIGLSGGMPGTKGAGYMTTGPHLHFEVMQNGAYVDPLRFLPLEVLTEDHISELPESYYGKWQMAIMAAGALIEN